MQELWESEINKQVEIIWTCYEDDADTENVVREINIRKMEKEVALLGQVIMIYVVM